MSDLPSILSAIAAAIAAVLAGLGLYVSGRREHRQWLRNSLVDSYVNYLTASFESGGREVLQARLRGEQIASLGEYLQQASKAHDRQSDVLTRLRLIAPPAVVEAAVALQQWTTLWLTLHWLAPQCPTTTPGSSCASTSRRHSQLSWIRCGTR